MEKKTNGEELSCRENYPQLLLESQLCFPLYAASRKVVNHYTPLLKPLGLTYTQYVAFLCLWEYGEMTVGDLCRRLYLDNGTVTPLMKKMEQEGYVTRLRCPEDERVVKLHLTESGWALREKVKEIPLEVGGCITLKHEDAMELHTLLHRLLKGDCPLEEGTAADVSD